MKLYATVSSERASKGQGGNDFVEVDLFGQDKIHLARLTLQIDADYPNRYRLSEDIFFRSDKLEILTYQNYESIPLKELKETDKNCIQLLHSDRQKGKQKKDEDACEGCGNLMLENESRSGNRHSTCI